MENEWIKDEISDAELWHYSDDEDEDDEEEKACEVVSENREIWFDVAQLALDCIQKIWFDVAHRGFDWRRNMPIKELQIQSP